ncbi:MAG TPA: hypothetical protein VNX68_04015 [Nitrosopumilaceae archaeon]|nr:hypothetical protein [Nitrosopumilaceae archaeon]
MNYVSWYTCFDLAKQMSGGKLSYLDFIKYSADQKRGFNAHASISEQCLNYAEICWIRKGKPYYNIHPSIIESTERMKLTDIPSSFLEVPRHFQSVNIRFPAYHHGHKSLLISKFENSFWIFGETGVGRSEVNRRSFSRIDLERNLTLEDCIEESKIHHPNDPFSVFLHEALRFCALIKFLSDVPDHELLSYDVVSKFKGEFDLESTTSERKKEIIAQSRAKGKIGWNVGVKEYMIRDCQRLSEPQSDREKYEQQWAHIRTGHLHAVRRGPGKKDVKIMFFRPTVVNKDKPFKDY